MTDDNPAWLLRKKKEEEYMATFLEDLVMVTCHTLPQSQSHVTGTQCHLGGCGRTEN